MEGTELTPFETAFQDALKYSTWDSSLTPEEIIEVAELGRKHPEFDQKMVLIAQSPTALALYMAAKETAPTSGLRRAADCWMEGLRRLPDWFDMVVAGLQTAPVLAYRSSAPEVSGKLRLVSPDPANQSVFAGTEEWTPAGDPASVLISIEEGGLDADHRHVTVTLAPVEESWSLNTEVSYLFRVLSEKEASKAIWAFDHAGDSPVAASMVLYSVGMFGEAERLLSRWPADPDLKLYSDSIARACQARRADARRLYL